MDERDFWTRRMDEVRKDLTAARINENQAVINSLMLRETEAFERLQELGSDDSKKRGTIEDMISRVVSAIPQMPRAAQERIARAACAALKLQVPELERLRVVGE